MLRRSVEVTAMRRHSAQAKAAPKGAAFDYLLFSYYFFLLATPTKPNMPEPNNHIA